MKKTVFFVALFIVLVGMGIYYNFFNKSIKSFLLKEEDIEQRNFLEDKQAILYFSSTIDQDVDNKGLSYAVFIDDEGKAVGFKMKSLELGTIAKGTHSVLLVDKDKVRLIGEKYKEFNMKKEQHTGERTGYLKEQNLYYSIFNTGVNKTSKGGYDSNVLFGNGNGFKEGNIPHYILASGEDKSEIIILTNDMEKKYTLRKVSFVHDEIKAEDIAELNNKEEMDYANLSPIVSDNHNYYIVLSEYINETSENTVLYRINKKTLRQEKFILATYKNSNDAVAAIPFNVRGSSYLFGNEFFFINGLGEVFSLDTKLHTVTRKFTIKNLQNDGVRHNEGTYFQDGNLYVMRYDDKRGNKYYIEMYSLNDGKIVKEIQMTGLEEILSSVKGKSIHSYDFKMLK